MNNSVVAVVVTFNRKKLLSKCLESLLRQTFSLEKIIIIDNNSSDGTENFIKKNEYVENKKIKYIRLNKNTGGSGGFHHGLRIALSENPDWFWLMDDDGLPDHQCLEMLLKNKSNYDAVGPLIISTENYSLSSFPYIINKFHSSSIEEIKNFETIEPVHPFNGTLISKKIVDKIGFPEKRFFIWGDEVDYRTRWIKNGFKNATITTAIYYHPPCKMQTKKIIPYAFHLTNIDNKYRKYLYYRNSMYNYRNEIGSNIIKSTVRFLLSVLVLLKDKDRWISIRALFHGYMLNLDKTPKDKDLNLLPPQ